MQKISFRDKVYRAASFVWHKISAWNTGGEGIHSPYLFYIVRFLMCDHNCYYCWRNIEARRQAMLRATRQLTITDFGTGQDREEAVFHIAQTALEDKKIAQLLFRLTLFLQQSDAPLNILELGTSLGISTAYLALPDSRNQVTTLEGAHEILLVAQHNFRVLGIQNIQCVEGDINSTLPSVLSSSARALNVVYMDANHTEEATLRYFNQLLPYLCEKSIVVVDDIHYSREMAHAWHTIQQHPQVSTTMDLWHCGLVFFDQHYIHRNYKLRI